MEGQQQSTSDTTHEALAARVQQGGQTVTNKNGTEETELSEEEIQKKLAEDAAEVRKEIALKQKRSKIIADAKTKANKPVKSLKQRLEEQRAALESEAEREDAVLAAAHEQQLKEARKPPP